VRWPAERGAWIAASGLQNFGAPELENPIDRPRRPSTHSHRSSSPTRSWPRTSTRPCSRCV